VSEHVQPVLDNIETVEEDKHCHHEARAEAEEACAGVVVTVDLGVEHQIVEGGDDKAKAEESVSCQPGKEERAEGEEEAEEE